MRHTAFEVTPALNSCSRRIISGFPPLPSAGWERVPEGRVRALRFQGEKLLKSSHVARKSPHPAFGHLLPCFAREKGSVGLPFIVLLFFLLFPHTAHAADLDGAGLSLPWALPFLGVL